MSQMKKLRLRVIYTVIWLPSGENKLEPRIDSYTKSHAIFLYHSVPPPWATVEYLPDP